MKDERYIDLKGTHNFRDIGGYETIDHHHVVFGKLYRSDDLHELDEADIVKFKSLGIKTIIDYRNEQERNHREDVKMDGVTTYCLDPKADTAALASSSFKGDEQGAMRELTAEKAKYMMIEQNRQFVLSKTSLAAYRKMFDIILDERNCAVVQHCRGGKDRTGFGIALILLSLGVSREDIIKDYMLTNYYKRDKNQKGLQKVLKQTQNEDLVQALRYLKEANEEFILTAFHEIDTLYGSTDRFLRQAILLKEHEIEKLKTLYTK